MVDRNSSTAQIKNISKNACNNSTAAYFYNAKLNSSVAVWSKNNLYQCFMRLDRVQNTLENAQKLIKEYIQYELTYLWLSRSVKLCHNNKSTCKCHWLNTVTYFVPVLHVYSIFLVLFGSTGASVLHISWGLMANRGSSFNWIFWNRWLPQSLWQWESVWKTMHRRIWFCVSL